MLDRAASLVAQKRLETPVTFALEMHRPLTFWGQQGMVFLQPILAPIVGWQSMDRLIALFADRENLDRFFDRLEARCKSRDAAPQTSATGAPTHE